MDCASQVRRSASQLVGIASWLRDEEAVGAVVPRTCHVPRSGRHPKPAGQPVHTPELALISEAQADTDSTGAGHGCFRIPH
jgi:hypothetical protein